MRLVMGIYLNPGNETFTEITNQEIYVDKTMMLAELNKIMRRGNKYICISRPHRFRNQQNQEKKYFSELAPYTGKIIFVGISYDKDTKTHACKIARFEK